VTVSLVLFGLLFLFMAANMPVGFAVGLSAAAALLVLPNVKVEVLVSRMFSGIDSFLIVSILLFLLLGEIMEQAKITDRLVVFAQSLVGRWRGGIVHTAIVTNTIMSGISGSGAADAAATGVALIPAMKKAGYSGPFAAAIIGAASTIGPVIPPSILMVVYASIANVSVGRMFLAGIVPGVLMSIALMIFTAWKVRRPAFNAPPARLPDVPLGRAAWQAAPVLLAPVIVIAGIVGGVFTATESAAVACLYALLLGMLLYRTVGRRDLRGILVRTATASAKVMFIVATASVFSWILARGGVPDQLATLPFFAVDAAPWKILLAFNVILFVLGMPMDSLPILLIFTPIILPIAQHAGIDPVHLGIVMTVNLSLGLVSPPFGTSLFVLTGIARCSLLQFTLEVWQPLFALIVVLLLVTQFPALSLALPDLLMGKG
jgi:C4-dicarboxylate transporter DctM subunit